MAEGNVTALKTSAEPPTAHKDSDDAGSVGLGTTMQFQIGREDKFEMQTILDRDAPLASWNATLDKMRRAGERQKIITGIQSLEANLKEQSRQLKRLAEDTKDRQDRERADMDDRKQRIQEITAKLTEFVVNDKQAFEGSGKRGEYKPDTRASQRIAAFEREIAKEQEAQEAADRDFANYGKSAMAEALSYKRQAEFCDTEIKNLRDDLAGTEG